MDKTKKLERIRKDRNYIKFRISGMMIKSLPVNSITHTEFLLIKKIELLRNDLLERFDYNSRMLGLK